ncbi:Tic22-like [Parasponia andersonii]|uniref:Tic22-like n=1 Tax=Parasponia andersonii TaxID=3476 RepID=A0A2P5CAX2_PARAD|nr:Tic22-like [Parasponia andersonii]
MASLSEPTRLSNPISHIVHSTTSNLLSLLNPNKTTPSSAPSRLCVPLLIPHSPKPLAFEYSQPDSAKSPLRGVSSAPESTSAYPSSVRIAGLRSNNNPKGGGPAFVGQVFSMCDLSGTGLMAVSTHFDIPFISQRTPEWLKKMFATITRSERKGPVFRFFLDLGDAVSYVKRLNIPSGVVGACRLDLAYEHFKEKPHLFQFVPNEKQIKAANKLLKMMPQNAGCKRVDGVPVFSAQNLDIAIATTDGIKWYTPYFFDKSMLDNILEESVDQHFHALIQTRHMQRRQDVIDDNLAAEVIEEMGDTLWEPPEVQEVMDEMGNPGIPLSVISKAAEMQLLYAVDKVLLGNRWLRKATGIQPKFPYMVDSFEKRSAASFLKASESVKCLANSQTEHNCKEILHPNTSELLVKDNIQNKEGNRPDLRLPFGDWFNFQPLKKKDQNEGSSKEQTKQNMQPSLLLPKITMVGISTGDTGEMSKASLKKTMDDLTKELEHVDQENATGSNSTWNNEFTAEDRDPLFVANVGDYYSGVAKTGSARWVRGAKN